MKLLVFRHGIAEDYLVSGSDETRALTEEGVEKTRLAAQGLAKMVSRIDLLLTSPLLRAVQTAEILGEVFETKPHVAKALAYGPPSAVARSLRRRREETAMIVGHEPTLSRLVELLLTGGEPTDFVQMKKAGCACVETPLPDKGITGGSKLLWLATPKMLRSMA